MSKFAYDNNVYFEFHSNACYDKSQGSKEVLLRGTIGSDGLYCFLNIHFKEEPSIRNNVKAISHNNCLLNAFVNNNTVNSVNSLTASSFSTWHNRLGHANSTAVTSALKLCNIPFVNKAVSDFCNACCLGKAHRLHAPSSLTSYNSVFELIFSDLWGPAPFISSNGFSYYCTFMDAHTRFTWIYFLKHKSDTLTAFKQFYKMIQTQYNASLKAVQTDWGGEYRPLTKHLIELGIKHRLTCPHTSHQNGSVERKHRQIVEMGLTLLAQASIPYKFWDHSFTAAVQLINILPTTALPNHTSPFYALHQSLPDYTSLRTFGCACFPHLRPYNQYKLQFRSTECVYLGASPQHKGYKCLVPDGRIYISKNVLFNEYKFPYSLLFPTNNLPTSSTTTFPSVIPFVPPNSATNLVQTSPQASSPQSPQDVSSHSSSLVHSNNEPPSVPNSAAAPSSPCPHTESLPILSESTSPAQHHSMHPMITRSKTGSLPPPRVLLTHREPSTIRQALSCPQWLDVMKAEYAALIGNNTWTLMPLPPHRQAKGCKWVFRIKENPDGSINKYKARLVAKGFHQQYGFGFDFAETFSPVVKPATIRIVLTLALTYGWNIQQIDVNNAFLNGYCQKKSTWLNPLGLKPRTPAWCEN